MRQLPTCARVLLVATVTLGVLVPALAGRADATRMRSPQACTRNATPPLSRAPAATTRGAAPTWHDRPDQRTHYRVRLRDTLTGIATRFGLPGGWPALYVANRDRIGVDPNLIRPGTVLTVPTRAEARYRVTPGDTLTAIATRYRLPGGWLALYVANRDRIGANPGLIHPGALLAIPARAGGSAPVRQPHHIHPTSHHRVPIGPSPAPSPIAHTNPHTAPGAARPAIPRWLPAALLAVAAVVAGALTAKPARGALGRVGARRQTTRPPRRALRTRSLSFPATPAYGVGDAMAARHPDEAPSQQEECEEVLSCLQRLVRDRLRERNWSYGEAAKRSGLPKSTIHHLATRPMRSRPPRPPTLEGLARGLELPLSAVRAAAAEDAGLHFYDEAQVDEQTPVLFASIAQLSPQDRRRVAALIQALRRRSQR